MERTEQLHKASTLIEYFDRNGKRIFRVLSPPRRAMQASLSSVSNSTTRASRRSGSRLMTAPGKNDDRRHDIVMMDDFIYGEPQPLQINPVRTTDKMSCRSQPE